MAQSPEGRAVFRQITDPLKDEVRRQGLWAAHLPPDMGGQGFGQVKLGLMHEILGQCAYAPERSSATTRPTSGNAELIAVGGTDDAARAVDAAAARRQDAQLLLDDRARRRRRPDAAHHDRRARRRRVGDQRPQVVLVERVDQRLPDRDGQDR